MNFCLHYQEQYIIYLFLTILLIHWKQNLLIYIPWENWTSVLVNICINHWCYEIFAAGKLQLHHVYACFISIISKRFKGDFSFFFISRLNMKNCGNFFNLTRKAKPVLSSINCTINVETCNISVHCWHTRLSFFIFVKKTS